MNRNKEPKSEERKCFCPYCEQELFASAPDQSASGVAKRFIELTGAGHNAIPQETLREAMMPSGKAQGPSQNDQRILNSQVPILP